MENVCRFHDEIYQYMNQANSIKRVDFSLQIFHCRQPSLTGLLLRQFFQSHYQELIFICDEWFCRFLYYVKWQWWCVV